MPITKQCQLLNLNRSMLYYHPTEKTSLNLILMRAMDELHLRYPFMGSRQLTAQLIHQDHIINRKRTQHLMRQRGLTVVYPKPKTSIKDKHHKIYPYLLRGLTIDHPNQVWCTDITYIPMKQGFVYLIAVMDWYSRKVLS